MKYGVPVYGLDTYGSTAAATTLFWGVDVDWDGDGAFSGRNEADNMVDFYTLRGRKKFIGGNGNGFEPMQAGECVITLDNSSGDYDPYNTSSALYPYVEPGKFIRVRVRNGDAGDTYHVFSGKIETIEPLWGNTNPMVQIVAYDGWKQLNETDITTDLEQSITTGDAITDVLDRANYPAIWGTNIDSGANTIDFWWENGIKASTAINRLWQSEAGKAAVLADGSFRFYQRGAIQSSVISLDQSIMRKDIQIPMPYDVIRNVAKVMVYPRIEQSTGDLWTLREKTLIKASESVVIWGSYSYNNRRVSAVDILTPVITTDYTMNTTAAGDGTDLTSDFIVTVEKFAESTKFTITNGSILDGYITLLKIRGNAIDAPDSTYVEDDNSGTSIKRVFTLDTPWIQSVTEGSDYAEYLSAILSTNQKYPRFQLEAQPAYQFGFDLLDKVTVVIGKYSINTNFGVGGIEHRWLSDNGQAVETTVYTEPFVSQTAANGYWVFTATFPMKFPY